MSQSPVSQPLIIAHRGNIHRRPNRSPENTIAAFSQAIAVGAHMIEFDVRTTQDQVLIVYHDPKVAGKPIAETPWPTLQTLNPQIPTLALALQHCQNQIRLDVEIKEIGNELAIVELLLKYLSTDDFAITSFNLKSLQTIKQHDPRIKIGLLLNRPGHNHYFSTLGLQHQIAQLQPNFLAPHYKLLNHPWLKNLNPTQLPYWVWTVNQPKQIQAMLNDAAIAAIITDNSESAITSGSPSETLRERSKTIGRTKSTRPNQKLPPN